MKNLFTLLLSLLIISGYANLPKKKFATTYYVSLTGNDANNGLTLLTAWRTNVYAGAHTTSGDVIYTQAGIFSETAQIVLPAGVSWHGIDSATTIIKSNVSADYTPMFDMSSAQGTNGNQSVYDLQFNGQLTNFLAVMVGGRSNVLIYNCSFKNFLDRGIYFSAKGDYTDGAPSIYSTGNKFYNNRVFNCARYQHPNGNFGMGCLNIGGQSGLQIYNNVINQTGRAVGDNGWPIKYANEGHNYGVLIHDNTLTKIPFQGNYNGDGDYDFCIELWYCEGGVQIYNNNIQGGIDLAYNDRFSPYTYSVYFHNNNVTQPTLNTKFQGGVYTERQVNGVLIVNNIFDKISCGVLMNIEDFEGQDPFQALHNILIQGNLMSNMGRNIGDGNNGGGIQLSTHPTATFTVDSLFIYNNTIVAAPGNAPFEGIYLNYSVAVGATTKVKIINNIVNGFQDYWLRVSNSASTIDNFMVKNNSLYQNAASNAILFVDGTPTNYTNSNNLLNSNPLFVSSTDYHVQALSPCINAGLNIGLPFFGTAPTIGYWQFGTPAGSQFIINRKIIFAH